MTYRIRVLALFLAFLGGCSPSADERQSLPSLLRGVSAGGGYFSACPPTNKTEAMMLETSNIAISPELNKRLQEQFPPGSADSRLVETLKNQGFSLGEPCTADPTIQHASFFQKGSGFLPYDINADIYWKRDLDGRIVWTKGLVAYTGL